MEKDPSKAAAWLQNHPSKEYQNYYRALIGLKKDEPFTEESIQRPFDDSVIW